MRPIALQSIRVQKNLRRKKQENILESKSLQILCVPHNRVHLQVTFQWDKVVYGEVLLWLQAILLS